MKLRATLAAGVLAASSVAFGVAGIGTVEVSSDDYLDAHKLQTGDRVETGPLGALYTDFETDRAIGMAPVARLDTGRMTDFQLQRRTFEEPDGSTRIQDVAVLGISGGSFDGFQMVDVTDPANPFALSEQIQCGGFHNDVAIWRDYVVLGWDGGSGPCPSLLAHGLLPSGGNGVYVFDVSDPTAPFPVATFDGILETEVRDTTSGAHNIGIHPDGYLYFATASVTSGEPDLGIVDLNDLEAGQKMMRMNDISPTANNGCHDLGFAFHEDRTLMACPAIGSTYIWDLADPMNPVEVAVIVNPAVTLDHGGRFSPDGSTFLLGDELGGGGPASCTAGGPTGAIVTYDMSIPEVPVPTGYISSSEPAGVEVCTAHFYNFVPTSDGSTKVVTGWYQSGMLVHDITNIVETGNPTTLVDAGPEVAVLDPTGASMWSAYAYYGHVFAGGYGSGTPGFFVGSLDGYTDTADAEIKPYCNDAGIVWGPWTADWRSECTDGTA